MSDAEADAADKYKLPKFRPEIHLPPPNNTFLAVGKTQSGKSTLALRATMWYLANQVETVVSFVPTSRTNHDPAFFVPPAHDYGDWDADRLLSIYSYFKDLADSDPSGASARYVMYVIDDCNAVSDAKGNAVNVYKSMPVIKIAKEGRHAKQGMFICAQNVTDLSVTVRKQARIVFLFYSANAAEIEWMRKEFSGDCPAELWQDLFPRATAYQKNADGTDKPRRCLVLDTKLVGNPSNPLAGMYIWAPPFISKPFRCGRAEYYALSHVTHVERKVARPDPWAAGQKPSGEKIGGKSSKRGAGSGGGGGGGGGGAKKGVTVTVGGGKKRKRASFELEVEEPIVERILNDDEDVDA